MIKRLCEELDGAASHGLNPHPCVSMSGNKDDGNVAFLFFQPGLQLQTGHLRHADVNDQASRPIMQIGREAVSYTHLDVYKRQVCAYWVRRLFGSNA